MSFRVGQSLTSFCQWRTSAIYISTPLPQGGGYPPLHPPLGIPEIARGRAVDAARQISGGGTPPGGGTPLGPARGGLGGEKANGQNLAPTPNGGPLTVAPVLTPYGGPRFT